MSVTSENGAGRRAARPAPVPALRITALALATSAVVAVSATAGAYWLCVPGCLLAAAIATTLPGAVAGAGAVAVMAEVALVWRGVEPLPPIGLALVVPAASVAVLLVTRRGVERERDQLRGVALSDGLTGVANRRLLLARADYEIARHTREQESFALVMLDLNGFKRLNDRFGHAAGDEILCDVADALTDALRGQDTVARLGGDEFCVLAPDTDRSHVAPLAGRIDDAVAGATAGVDQLGASIGIAIFPEDGRTAAELMEAADQRLLGAKRTHYARSRRRAA